MARARVCEWDFAHGPHDIPAMLLDPEYTEVPVVWIDLMNPIHCEGQT